MKSRQHLLILLVFILTAILVLIISSDFKDLLFRSPQIDSIGHFVGFFLLTWLLNGIFKFPLVNLCICLIFYSALTEVGQFYLGFRNGELGDFVADVVGIGCYGLIKWAKIVYGKKPSR